MLCGQARKQKEFAERRRAEKAAREERMEMARVAKLRKVRGSKMLFLPAQSFLKFERVTFFDCFTRPKKKRNFGSKKPFAPMVA